LQLATKGQETKDPRYSYGWQRAEVLGALINGVFLLALCFSIFMEALERLFNVTEVSSPKVVVIVGSLGLASNVLGLFLTAILILMEKPKISRRQLRMKRNLSPRLAALIERGQKVWEASLATQRRLERM
jgi:Co/Zn/Cd efflux system component